MTVMIAEVYDALKSAGADEEKARRAAEAVADARSANLHSQMELRSDMQKLDSGLRQEMQSLEATLRSEMQSLRAELRSEMQALRSEMNVMKWMLGGVLAIAVAIFLRTLFAEAVGALTPFAARPQSVPEKPERITMSAFLKMTMTALFGSLLAVGPARAIDPFFPEFGNNGIDVLHYDLELDVTPDTGRLDAEATLRILALQQLTEFSLDLSRLQVSSVEAAGAAADFSQADGKLTIVPRRALAKGDVFEVEIAYAGRPRPIPDPTVVPNDPAYQLGWFRYRDASYALSEPVGASTFYPANDEPTDKASFTIAVTVPQGFTGVANGVLRSTSLAGGKKRFVWEMRQPMTTWLATVHVNRFRVRLGSTPDGTQLRFYYTAATPAEDVDGYARARQMLIEFERLLGRYPFGGYGSVVVDDPVLYYALETQAMSTFPLGAAYDAIVAHELAHQWFGNSVSVARWRDLWIGEGAATYFEYVWANRNNADRFHRDLRDLYRYVKQQRIGPAVVESPEQMFTDRTYLRGASALYALQLKVGDRTFFRILRTFLKEFRDGNATSRHFIRTAVRVTGDKSVGDLLHDWLYEEPVPPLPGQATGAAAGGSVAPPDVVGLRCGRGSHRGAPATCGAPAAHAH